MDAIAGLLSDLKTLVLHMLASHHGQYEFGSPKLPMFPEALLLHYMDDLDSKMESMRALFERETDPDNPWTSYSPSLGRPLLNTARFLAAKVPVPPEPEVPGPSETLPLPGLGMSEEDTAAPAMSGDRPVKP